MDIHTEKKSWSFFQAFHNQMAEAGEKTPKVIDVSVRPAEFVAGSVVDTCDDTLNRIYRKLGKWGTLLGG